MAGLRPDEHDDTAPVEADDAIRAVVDRLSRPHPSGGAVIERAAILASGGDTTAVLRCVEEHGGVAEELAPAGSGRRGGGLHDRSVDVRRPLRYVLPQP